MHYRLSYRMHYKTESSTSLISLRRKREGEDSMKWGIVYASTSFPEPDRAVAMATAAEAAGFESLWCPEHVVVPVGRDATPYRGSLDGKMDRVWRRGGLPDPLIWLAFVASHTTTIQLGTNVVIVPEHQPAVLAKSVATLDALSGGRVQLGVGVGELPEEYGAVGMEFTNRGQRMDEYLEAMRLLWKEEVASYHGQFVGRRGAVRPQPAPRHGAHPRRWDVIGGHPAGRPRRRRLLPVRRAAARLPSRASPDSGRR